MTDYNDTTKTTLTDGRPVTPDHREIDPRTGQQKAYTCSASVGGYSREAAIRGWNHRAPSPIAKALGTWEKVRPFLVVAPEINNGVSSNERNAIEQFIDAIDEAEHDLESRGSRSPDLQRCPICEGRGAVAFNPAMPTSSTDCSAGPWTCPTCNGLRVISQPSVSPTPTNQCDGCKLGLPIERGIHIRPESSGYDRFYMGCTANRYVVSPTSAGSEEMNGLRARLNALTEVHEFYEFDATDEEHFDLWLHERIKEVRVTLGLSPTTSLEKAPLAESETAVSPTPAESEQRDAERLNWLESGGHSAMHFGDRRYQVHDQTRIGLREAIDAAIEDAAGWKVRSEPTPSAEDMQ